MIQILQCWDDGVLDDIRLCEILRAHGAKASFNLNPGLHGATRSAPWRYKECKDVSRLATSELISVYEGFTIANHTDSHPWPLKIPITEWRSEVFDGRKQLQDLFQQPILGFAYPYGQHDEATAAVVAEAGHTYRHAVLKTTPCHPSPDRFRQPTDCHHVAPDFWEIFERAKTAGALFSISGATATNSSRRRIGRPTQTNSSASTPTPISSGPTCPPSSRVEPFHVTRPSNRPRSSSSHPQGSGPMSAAV